MASERMRVHRALALAGIASRRAAEGLVAEGRVLVNGEPATVGQLVGPEDRLEVDGRPVREPEQLRAYLLHKPAGVVSTAHDPQGRPTVLDGLPADVRVYPVGRLDLDTTGALLVTNDGELAARLMHPSSSAPKTYEALLQGRVSAATVRRLRRGVELEDGMTAPARVRAIDRPAAGGTWLEIEIIEGRNRQVRRMGEAVGHRVLRLHRSRYAGVGLGRLAPGRWRPITRVEWTRLGATVGLER
jgi:pseudouridine synthase